MVELYFVRNMVYWCIYWYCLFMEWEWWITV